MLFSSLTFLYWFLPAAILLYFIVPNRLKNLILLFASLVFYFYGEPKYLAVMLFSTIASFLFGLWMGHCRKNKKNLKLPFVLSICTSVALLMFFKYTDFIIGNLNLIPGIDISLLNIALPIGISFYTFQQISYTVDVYRGDAQVQKNFINYACYITMFPQLVAGPIVRYTVIEAGLKNRSHSIGKFSDGAFRFAVGLGKKVLVANTLAELTSKFSDADEKTVLFYWVFAVAYTLQVYFDFSGYSDMAIGLGKIFGFEFPENFNYPFISKSISEFWRRWHISLGSWFRDYIYIPLGGNRVSLAKWLRNIMVVWFLTGLWHGASWNFILWGLYFAVFLVMEKLFLSKLLSKIPRVFSHIYVVIFILFSFVLFGTGNLAEFAGCVSGMLGLGGTALASAESIYYLKSYGIILVLAIVGSTPIIKLAANRLSNLKGGKQAIEILKPVALAALFISATAFLADGSFNPFLYFRF